MQAYTYTHMYLLVSYMYLLSKRQHFLMDGWMDGNKCSLKEIETRAVYSQNIEQTFHYNNRGKCVVFQFVWFLTGEINQ